ncbi:unnamed protein product [Ambrosiozyma monospora]|uniref:Unnamed protein product n=1 Tax=Ambrosiozyma monospora TaxID=43982 RepID=A0ACB5U4S9_AMBMO|nr:unnamed protein product [Ambrosiozyma monospora]
MPLVVSEVVDLVEVEASAVVEVEAKAVVPGSVVASALPGPSVTIVGGMVISEETVPREDQIHNATDAVGLGT